MTNPTPEAVVTAARCSLCGLDWLAHGDDPTVLDCIRLLKADTARQVQDALLARPVPLPGWPVTVPCLPCPPQQSPFWYSPPIVTCGSDTTCCTSC